jgi:hypothetical protein
MNALGYPVVNRFVLNPENWPDVARRLADETPTASPKPLPFGVQQALTDGESRYLSATDFAGDVAELMARLVAYASADSLPKDGRWEQIVEIIKGAQVALRDVQSRAQ